MDTKHKNNNKTEKTKKNLRDISNINNISDTNCASKSDLSILNSINQTETDLKYSDILEAFAQQAKASPDSILVQYKEKSYTYSQGALIASSIAKKLNDEGILPHSNIAIFVPRSEWYLLASLGVLTHGSAYVPIDTLYPDNRIAFMLEDTNADAILVIKDTKTQAEYILATKKINTKLIEIDTIKTSNTKTYKYTYHPPRPKDNAFIVYTSGTTGKPKAIQITRIGILNCAQWYVENSRMNKNDVYAMYSAFVFDMHIVGFYSSILCVATINIVPQKIRLDMDALNTYLEKVKATHTYLPTQIGRVFIEQHPKTSLKFLLVIGEKLGEFQAPQSVEMWESYGPTETLTFVTAIKVNDRKYPNCVGKPIANTKLYVLDAHMRKVPIGTIGELYVSTKQISNGYLNRDSENEAAFHKNPFDGNIPGYEMMYKTGDMVVILPDKTLGFVGRKDSQVKIRGNRVELTEVESSIRELDFITDVTANTFCPNVNQELVVYVVVHENSNIKEQEIKEKIITHIKSNKPDYMVPSYIELIDEIPLNTNGKVDKKSLPLPSKTSTNADLQKASTVLEANMIQGACEALYINEETIGTNTDLTRCGLDSVSAIRLSLIWKEKCNIDVSAFDILKKSSIDAVLKSCPIEKYQPIQIPYKTSCKKTLIFVHARNSSSISYLNLMEPFTGKFSFACLENYNLYHLSNPIRGYKNIAKKYVEFLLDYQKSGPYYLGGWSCGGCIVFEMAAILEAQGHKVEKLYLLDPVYAENTLTDKQILTSAKIVNDAYFGSEWSKNITQPFSEQLLREYEQEYLGQNIDELSYKPSHYNGPVVFFKASEKSEESEDPPAFDKTDISPQNRPQAILRSSHSKPANGFEKFIANLRIIKIPTEHDNLMFKEPARMIAQEIEKDMQI